MTRKNELLNALESTPRDLVRAIQGVDTTTWKVRPTPEKLSISDILNMMFFIEVRYLERFQQAAQEDNPLLPYVLPNQALLEHPASMDSPLDHFTEARTQTLQYLRSLPLRDWQRPATFEDGWKTNLRYLVQRLVDHDTEHLNQLIKIKMHL